jgi:hypothetical protein
MRRNCTFYSAAWLRDFVQNLQKYRDACVNSASVRRFENMSHRNKARLVPCLGLMLKITAMPTWETK